MLRPGVGWRLTLAKYLSIKIYPSYDSPVLFYFDHTTTLRDLEQTICAEIKAYDKQGLDFYICDGKEDKIVEDKSQNFLLLLQFENLKLKNAGKTISYFVKPN